MTLTLRSDLTEAEHSAVLESARRMRAWSDRCKRESHELSDRHQYRSGREKFNGGRKCPVPCQPIGDLRERGEIDGLRDTKLTALAFRLSREER